MCGNFGRYAFILCLLYSVWTLGSAQLTFSSNRVYSGDPVTLTCNYGSGVTLLQVTVEAFSGTQSKGFLYCNTPGSANTTSVGVFQGTSFTGCPMRPDGATNVNVTLTATPELQLNYSCTTRVTDGNTFSTNTSGLVSLQVLVVCPSPPSFQPSPITFNDSDNGSVVCNSPNGRPAALLSLSANASTGASVPAVNGSNSTMIQLPSPLSNWHGATVTCRVINNNCANMTATSSVFVYHVNVTGHPEVVHTGENNNTLNCSSYIVGYPGITYSWAIPPEVIFANQPYVNGPQLQVLQGQSGLFNCTATNNVTEKNVTVVFTVSNTVAPTTTILPPPSANLVWLIGLFVGIVIVVVIAVVLSILCKRGHFSKGRKPDVEPCSTNQRHDNDSHRGSFICVYDGPATTWKASTAHDNDADAVDLVCRHHHASAEATSHSGRVPSTPDVPAKDLRCAEDMRTPNRLLIASEGMVKELSRKALSTTVVVEFSDGSCSLSDILEIVKKVVTRSPAKFESMALLLRPAKVGLTLSDVDRVALSSNIQGEKGEKARDFLVRLVEMCVDKNCSDARLDILNYEGKAPLRLKNSLAELLKIAVTVSSDKLGVNVLTNEKSNGGTPVADTYFGSNGDIVYAELAAPGVQPQIHRNKVTEPVIYSEIKHKN